MKETIKNIYNENFDLFLDLILDKCEKQILYLNNNYYTVMHKLTNQITIVEQGEGITILNNNEYSISKGDVIFIPKGTSHTFKSNSLELILLHYHTPKKFISTDLIKIKEDEE